MTAAIQPVRLPAKAAGQTRLKNRSPANRMRSAGSRVKEHQLALAQVQVHPVVEGQVGHHHLDALQVVCEMRSLGRPARGGVRAAFDDVLAAGPVADHAGRPVAVGAEDVVNMVVREQHPAHRLVGDAADLGQEGLLHRVRAQGVDDHAVVRADHQARIAVAGIAVGAASLDEGEDAIGQLAHAAVPLEEARGLGHASVSSSGCWASSCWRRFW